MEFNGAARWFFAGCRTNEGGSQGHTHDFAMCIYIYIYTHTYI